MHNDIKEFLPALPYVPVNRKADEEFFEEVQDEAFDAMTNYIVEKRLNRCNRFQSSKASKL